MNDTFKKITFAVFGLIILLAGVSYMVQNHKPLPVLGMLPEFSLTNATGDQIGLDDLKGKVWVADFIFTTCTMACPVLTGNMNLIHKAFKNNDNIRIVSISVYPEYDTPQVLSDYASQYDANTNRWHFLTGPEENVQDVIKNGFKMGDYEDIIFHSEKFALVDQKNRLRGYYNGMQTDDVTRLKKDMEKLLKEN